jgi:histidinol phosphatase-like PHP family hydrolase
MKPLNKLLSFYKNYYKELHQETIKSPSFLIMLEFDIVVRFNIRPTKEELKQIIEAIQGG